MPWTRNNHPQDDQDRLTTEETIFLTTAKWEAIEKARNIPGWTTDAELEWLYKTARTIRPDTCIVEIGTYLGRSTTALAYGAGAGGMARVFTVDVFDKEKVKNGPVGDRALAHENLDKLGVTIIDDDSVHAGRAWTGQEIGFLYVDGDHSYHGCRDDLLAWLPHVTPFGLVAGHDYDNPQWLGVAHAFDDLYRRLYTVRCVDSIGCGRLREGKFVR